METEEIKDQEIKSEPITLETLLSTETIIKQDVKDCISKVVTEETFSHPDPAIGDITRQYIYTFDSAGKQINKEAYVPEPDPTDGIVKLFQSLSDDQLTEIKKVLGL